MRILPLLLGAALLAGGCAHSAAKRARAGASPNPVPTVAARQTTVRGTSSISGIIAPFENVAITSSLGEPADKVDVLQGDRVRVGRCSPFSIRRICVHSSPRLRAFSTRTSARPSLATRR